MSSPRTPTLSAAQRRYDDWRLTAFEMQIADEALRRRGAKNLRQTLRTGALIGIIFSLIWVLIF
jgi:hypothetical protein